jgi:hypothetical protein
MNDTDDDRDELAFAHLDLHLHNGVGLVTDERSRSLSIDWEERAAQSSS